MDAQQRPLKPLGLYLVISTACESLVHEEGCSVSIRASTFLVVTKSKSCRKMDVQQQLLCPPGRPKPLNLPTAIFPSRQRGMLDKYNESSSTRRPV